MMKPFYVLVSFGAAYLDDTKLSGAVPSIMTKSEGSFCLPVCVNVCVYLSGAVSLIFHCKGGATYRGQCFPEFYTFFICSCVFDLWVFLQLLFAIYRSRTHGSSPPHVTDTLQHLL